MSSQNLDFLLSCKPRRPTYGRNVSKLRSSCPKVHIWVSPPSQVTFLMPTSKSVSMVTSVWLNISIISINSHSVILKPEYRDRGRGSPAQAKAGTPGAGQVPLDAKASKQFKKRASGGAASWFLFVLKVGPIRSFPRKQLTASSLVSLHSSPSLWLQW